MRKTSNQYVESLYDRSDELARFAASRVRKHFDRRGGNEPIAALGQSLLGALLVGLMVFSCTAAVAPERPSIVVILIDQLRKDTADAHLSRTTDLAKRGIVFDQMRSAAPWTYPSVISLMSGLYPQQHGADGKALENVLTTFSQGVPLLQGILRAHGYRTAAFVANPFLHKWNPFHEGFDTYHIEFVPSHGNLRGSGDLRWSPNTMFANTVTPAVFRYFEGTRFEGPEFTYIHYIDVHGPFEGAPFPPDYQLATEYLDGYVVKLYEFFMKRYEGDLIFVVTSDHGRALVGDQAIAEGRPWRKNKKSLHDFNVRIPFMILPSNRVRGPKRIEQPASNVDFVPTLLDWLGIERVVDLPGASFLPAIRGDRMPSLDRALYARMSAFHYRTDSIVYRGRKYMRYFDPRDLSLTRQVVFDLASDPHEVAPNVAEFDAIEEVFADAASNHGLDYPATVEVPSADLKRNLQALGYLVDPNDSDRRESNTRSDTEQRDR